MNKKAIVIAFVILISIFLFSCDFSPQTTAETTTQSDYEIWKNSDEAEDLNGDRKINVDDYDLYLNPPQTTTATATVTEITTQSDYEIWKNSDEAEDLNADRKINEDDYDLYLNPPQSNYEIWKNSDEAENLNNDNEINEADYSIYLEFSEFAGDYNVTNYSYIGSSLSIQTNDLNSVNSIELEDLGQYLNQMVFSIDNDGDVYASIPSTVIASLGVSFAIVIDGLNNMSLARISPYLVALDTNVTIDDIIVHITLYLTETESGFSTTYVINYDENISTVTFNLVKE
jgi:hypothetical protein